MRRPSKHQAERRSPKRHFWRLAFAELARSRKAFFERAVLSPPEQALFEGGTSTKSRQHDCARRYPLGRRTPRQPPFVAKPAKTGSHYASQPPLTGNSILIEVDKINRANPISYANSR
jgi:hypothetical protein